MRRPQGHVVHRAAALCLFKPADSTAAACGLQHVLKTDTLSRVYLFDMRDLGTRTGECLPTIVSTGVLTQTNVTFLMLGHIINIAVFVIAVHTLTLTVVPIEAHAGLHVVMFAVLVAVVHVIRHAIATVGTDAHFRTLLANDRWVIMSRLVGVVLV